jgi:6-phosphogluconate dehydrogenase
MKRGLGMSDAEMGDVFAEWNKGVLDSFLIEITRDVLRFNDDDGTALVEKILDSAGQKGTGKWTAINALDLGMPVTLIGEAVFARCLSSIKAERGRASKVLSGPSPKFDGDKKTFIANLEQALYASKIISYAQGFMLMQTVSTMHSLSTIRKLTNLGCQRVWMEAQQAVDCSDVAWWLHHSISLPQGHHLCLPCQPRLGEFALQRLLQQGHPQCSRRMA